MILTELHQSWMDDQDKADFDLEMMRQFGAQIDADIDVGISNGFTEQQQYGIIRSLLRTRQNN